MTTEEKAKKVKEYAAIGPIVIYCSDDLHTELVKQDLEILVADQDVDHAILKTLNQQVDGKFRVVVVLDKSAMRGLDYRSSDKIQMTLIVAKSFNNKREAMQGYHRVGRLGDKCLRVICKDNP